MAGRREVAFLAGAWAVLTAGGVALALSVPFFPSPASREAGTIDGAMALLAALSAPIFALVVVVLVYSLVRFRRHGDSLDDGPPLQGNLKLEIGWVAVTLVLVLFLAGYGSRELLVLRAHAADEEGALVVQARGSQWFWEFTYPEQGIKTKEALVLPVGRPVYFQITSADVIHSFWVPAFRVKIDAVPGLVTSTGATPDRTGRFQQEDSFRVQCAELCGLGHAAMAVPVMVLEPGEFEAWVSQQRLGTTAPGGFR